jgi:hypothetical protein
VRRTGQRQAEALADDLVVVHDQTGDLRCPVGAGILSHGDRNSRVAPGFPVGRRRLDRDRKLLLARTAVERVLSPIADVVLSRELGDLLP